MALGTSAFAIDNVKVSGEAKVWYQTSEFDGDGHTAAQKDMDMFDNTGNSLANVSLMLGATMDLLPNLSMGASAYALSTLGLENNLVGDVPSNKIASGVAGNTDIGAQKVDDQGWVRELYLAYTMGKTTAKIGRQELNTPLAFTEKWNVVDNTFDAAVLLNNDLPDTTLVAAWVGKHNGIASTGSSTVNWNGEFETFGTDGAYAFAAINKSIPNTTMQGWYYNVCNIADAFWLQADSKLFDIVELGVQYADMDPKASGAKSTDIWAVKAGVNVANSNFYAAYSSASNGENNTNFSNVSTGDKSNIYTAQGSIYMDGEFTTKSDTDAWKVGASTKLIPNVTLSASYGEAEAGENGTNRTKVDYDAWDIVANTKVGPLGLTAIYTQYSIDSEAVNADKDFDTLRIIASLKF